MRVGLEIRDRQQLGEIDDCCQRVTASAASASDADATTTTAASVLSASGRGVPMKQPERNNEGEAGGIEAGGAGARGVSGEATGAVYLAGVLAEKQEVDAAALASTKTTAAFWGDVTRGMPDACWSWRGLRCGKYGAFWLNRHKRLAHRVAFMLTKGREIRPKFQIDHLCFNSLCCNPAHLDEVPQSVNTRRAILAGVKKTPRPVRDRHGVPPTDKQLEALRWIRDYSLREGLAPTVREIGEALGLLSTNATQDRLRALMSRGLLSRRDHHIARSLMVTDLGRKVLEAAR
jgi:hypothetical protein